MYGQCCSLNSGNGKGGTQSCQRGRKLAGIRHTRHRLGSYRHKRQRTLHKPAKLLLHVTKPILKLLLLPGIGLGKLRIHVANIRCYHLGKHRCTLALRTKLQHLFLTLVKGHTHTLQHLHLPLHRLAHHVAYAHSVLIGGIQAILLRY